MTNEFNPKVSILIPVYNGSNFLKEAIESALAQTYQNIEIIVINDGSSDNGATEQIARSFGNEIQYYTKDNGGTSTALNLGISKMTGEYFSWLSHDDMYYPNKIHKQINELNKLPNKNTIMMTDLNGINENKQIIYKTKYIEHIKNFPPREKSFIHPIIYNQTHGCTLLIPKICFDEVGLFDEKQIVAQDFEFFYRAFLKFPHKLIPEILVTARESPNRQGKSKKELCDVEYSKLFISMIENLSEDEIKLLAVDKFSFYKDMQDFFYNCEYSIALTYINKKIINNLQISSYDLIGNKFNGHDLHQYLRQEGYDSKQVVLFKESKDISTIKFDFEKKNSSKELLQKDYFLEADIVHLHLIHNLFDLNYLPLMCRLKPTVITLHDPFFLAGHCVHHFDCTKWKSHCADCPYLNELFPLTSDYSALNFDLKKQSIQMSNITAIVASKWMENKVIQSPIWNGKKVYFLPFGINQEIFKFTETSLARRKLGLPDNCKVLFFRSDSGSFKGLDIIKDALLKIGNQDNIILITVGEKGILKELNKVFQIFEYGWINNDLLLSNIYQACDISLMPSRQETFGMMAIEAMSCGKMVLALNAEGSALPEIINSPNCGIAVREEDYAAELQRLLNNQGEVTERGSKSAEYAKNHYSKDKYIHDLLLIYKEIMATHQIDENSKIVLEQLIKYLPNKITNKLSSKVRPTDASLFFNVVYDLKLLFVKIFRKLPIKIQKVFEPLLINLYGKLLKYLK